MGVGAMDLAVMIEWSCSLRLDRRWAQADRGSEAPSFAG